MQEYVTVDLSDKGLKLFPSIGELTQSLDISSNQLTWLPESISNLSRLEKLDLAENKLVTLPISIGKLTKYIKDYPMFKLLVLILDF